MTRHLLQFIYKLLRPKNPLRVAIEEPILFNNLTKGDAKWGTQKTLLGWAIETVDQFVTL